MPKKQTLNLRQGGNNTISIPLAGVHRYSPSETFAQSHPYSGGTISCFLKQSLCWKYKQLLFKGIPTVHGRYKQLLSKGIPTLEV